MTKKETRKLKKKDIIIKTNTQINSIKTRAHNGSDSYSVHSKDIDTYKHTDIHTDMHTDIHTDEYTDEYVNE